MTKKLTPDTFTNFNFLSDVQLSSDNKHGAFVVKSANETLDDYDSNIWLYNFKNENTTQLTRSNSDGKFVWVNNHRLLFTSNRDTPEDQEEEQTTFYSINISGGEAKKEFTVPHKAEAFRWLNGKIIYKSLVSIEENDSSDKKTDEEPYKPTYRILDEIPFWANGKGFTNKKREHLFLYNPEEDNSTDLTEGAISVAEFTIENEQIAFIGTQYENKLPITNDIYLVNISQQSPEPKKLTASNRQFRLIEFYDEASLFVSSTDMETTGINENHHLYLFDLNDNTLQIINKGWKSSVENRVLTDVRLGGGQSSTRANGKMYFVSTGENHSALLSIDSTGQVNQLTTANGSIDSFDVTDDKIVFVKLHEDKLQEIFTRFSDNREAQLTKINKETLSGLPIAKSEHFSAHNQSMEIDARIITPPDFDDEQTYPAILEVHGGPKATYGDVYFHEMQLLASRGYVVIFSNPRGSDGRGDKFADIRGKYGKVDYQDLSAVLDKAIEKYPFIDEERLGVTGGSYGGFMTNWIIGHTDRFKAAVSCRSIANWISKFNTTDIGYYFVADQQDGNPWEDHDKLWEQSPLKYADQVTTPTLFIHSEEDYRCWMAEGLQMFTALKYFDVDSKLCLFQEENHDLSRSGNPANRIARLDEMLNWFDRYLKD